MRILSWVILTIVTVLIMVASLGSASIAYFGDPTNEVIVGSTSLGDLQIGDDVKNALRGRRGTAAAFALGFCCLMLFVILGPYRKGTIWAWWAVLCSFVLVGGTMLLRILPLGMWQGASIGGIILLITIPALLLDSARLARKPKQDSTDQPVGT
jgi:hypothetical protein